jgi:SAM-dependent methyltransferase
VHQAQESYPDDLAEMVRWVSGHVQPGQRVLEIGCGDGAVTARLAAAGIDVLGVDPSAPDSPHTRAIAVEELDEAPFDVLFASVSLHHLGEPDGMVAALRRVSRPGTVLLVREFDRELTAHEPTLRWWFHQRQAEAATAPAAEPPATGPEDGCDREHGEHEHGEHEHNEHGHGHDIREALAAGDFEEFAAGWREMMDEHVLPWATVRQALEDAGFALERVDTGPYLFRWELAEAVRPLEEQLIRDGRINAVGVRCVARRRT